MPQGISWTAPGLSRSNRQLYQLQNFTGYPKRYGPYSSSRSYKNQDLPHGGGPYGGNYWQQGNQGASDLMSAIGQIMDKRRKDQIGWALMRQSGISDEEIAALRESGMTGDEAYQQELMQQAIEREEEKSDVDMYYKRALAAKALGWGDDVASDEPNTKVVNGVTYVERNGDWYPVGGRGSTKSPYDTVVGQLKKTYDLTPGELLDSMHTARGKSEGGKFKADPKGDTIEIGGHTTMSVKEFERWKKALMDAEGQPSYDDSLGGGDEENLTSDGPAGGAASKDQEAIAWAKAHPDDPRAKRILALHGL